MKKIVLIAGIIILTLAAGIGGTIAALSITGHKFHTASAAPKPTPPSPLYFAQLNNVVVTVPATPPDPSDPSDPPSSAFVQFGIQFQTEDAKQVTNFNTVEPIVQSQVMRLLMQENGQSLQNTAEQSRIESKSLNLVNTLLVGRHYARTPPFTEAFITNLVVQD